MLEEAQQQVSEQPRPDLPLDRLFVLEHGPVALFSDVGVARAVGVGEGVALRRHRATDPVDFRLMQPECVANLVQAGRSRNVSIEQGEDVAESRKLPDVGPLLPRQPINQAFRNPLDDLTQRGVRCSCWPWECSLGGAEERVQPR